jgi:hypothetical protein
MPNTMTLIASSTVGSGGAASIDFTSIPSTYTDLCVVISARGSAAVVSQALMMSINGLTTGRTARSVNGTGSATSSSNNSDTEIAPLVGASATASTFTSSQVYLTNYSGSNNKGFMVNSTNENNATASNIVFRAGLWSATSVINQLTFTPDSGTFVQYTTAYIYGVKNA